MNISRHDRGCADHRIIPDSDAFQDRYTSTDPDVAADPNRTSDKTLFGNQGACFGGVVVVSDVTEWPDKTVTSNFDTFGCIKDGEAVDVCTATYYQSGSSFAGARRHQHYFIIQSNQ